MKDGARGEAQTFVKYVAAAGGARARMGDQFYGAKQPAKSRTLVVCPTSVRDLVFCIFT